MALAPPPAQPSADAIGSAFDALMAGHEREARGILKSILRRDPQNASASLLMDAMNGDAKAKLGNRNYRYRVHDGDTPASLARRLLGNRLLAYSLLRYNGLAAPATLTVGQELLIPGDPPRPAPVRSEAAPRDNGNGATRPAAMPAHNAPVAVCDLHASQVARTAGLAALNQGNLARAVQLLRAAADRYSCNPQIGRDLARATRIAATVKARR